MKIAVGSDHRGQAYKKYVLDCLAGSGHQCQDFGAYSSDAVDYPDVARPLCEAVAGGHFDSGILICGTGIGMSIAANKVNGIRAALCCDVFSAERARLHNNANVICLGAERGTESVPDILRAFLNTPFEAGRHQRRLDKIADMEKSTFLDKQTH
jgi:ribose 5-phosphate isomerase B